MLGWRQDTVEATQDDHRKHDQAILRRPVRSPKPVAISQILAFSSSCVWMFTDSLLLPGRRPPVVALQPSCCHSRVDDLDPASREIVGIPRGDCRRCCTNRHRPARGQSTGSSSPDDAIRHWSAEVGHQIEDLTTEDGLTPLPSWTPGEKTIAGYPPDSVLLLVLAVDSARLRCDHDVTPRSL